MKMMRRILDISNLNRFSSKNQKNQIRRRIHSTSTITSTKKNLTKTIEDEVSKTCSSSPSASFLMNDNFHDSKKKKKKVYVAMSGGVDSSVSASLLVEAGYQVESVFMKNWINEDDDHNNNDYNSYKSEGGSDRKHKSKTRCEWKKDWDDVKSVCKQLSIPSPHLMDFSKEYWNKVWLPCIEVWENGGTPNPDVLCNKYIKFGIFARRILDNDPDALIATGHYARLTYELNNLRLLNSKDQSKDQSYYLSLTSSSILRRTLFPIGDLSKTQVRSIAKSLKLVNSDKVESMGVCFVEPNLKKGRFDKFLEDFILDRPGEVISKSGKVLGTHNGLWRYTIGQRFPLKNSKEGKFYVSKKILGENRLVVVPNHDNPDLYSDLIHCKDFNWITTEGEDRDRYFNNCKGCSNSDLKARLRTGNLKFIPCELIKDSKDDYDYKNFKIKLGYPEHGVSIGQVIVIQDGDRVLGGGFIDQSLSSN